MTTVADNFNTNLVGNPTLIGSSEPRAEWWRDGSITVERQNWVWSGESDVLVWTRSGTSGAAEYYGPVTATGGIYAYGAVGQWATVKARARNYDNPDAGEQILQLKAGATVLASQVLTDEWQDIQLSAEITTGLDTEPLLWLLRWTSGAGGTGKRIGVAHGTVGLYVTDTDPSTWENGGGGGGGECEEPPFAPAGPRLYRDRVGLSLSGAPEIIVPAQLFPLGSAQTVDLWDLAVLNRYQVLLAPRIDIPLTVDGKAGHVKMSWGPYQLSESGDARLIGDGAVERHYRRGRLHHYEIICKSRG